MPKSIIDLNATKENAINELNDFIDNRLHSYESMRNYDLGENNHQNVSLLSPYIRHRLITEQEVISAALNKFPLPKIEKFIQEVLWRTYWKGWLELRPRVWDDYKDNILINNDKKQLLEKVLSYKTDSKNIAQASEGLKAAMKGLDMSEIPDEQKFQERGW